VYTVYTVYIFIREREREKEKERRKEKRTKVIETNTAKERRRGELFINKHHETF